MASNVPYLPPNLLAETTAGLSPTMVPFVPLQATGGLPSRWARGAILVNTPTGTIVTPSGGAGTTYNPSAGAIAGPQLAGGQGAFNVINAATSITSGCIQITGVASATAPALTYYVIVTATITTGSNETASSQEFIINCAAGFVPAVNVITTGTVQPPAGAVTYAVYVGLFPGYEALQQATKYTTAIGTAFTIPFPLTNNMGLSAAASNANAHLFGMAVDDSDGVFYNGSGGAASVGNQSLFGSSMTQGPLTGNEAFFRYVYKLQNQLLEMSLIQAWSPALAGTAAGITLDPTTGIYVVDTTATACGIIGQAEPGPQSFQGGPGLTGSRVQFTFNTGLV